MEEKLKAIINSIEGCDKGVYNEAVKRLDSLAKPPGSLGRLESFSVQIAAIKGKLKNSLDKRCLIIMCSDNGIVEEGVASAPQNVTYFMSVNFTRGLTGAAVLAKQYHTDLKVVDLGINADVNIKGIINRKIRKSTGNFTKEPAMTREEALQSITAGIEMADECFKEGYDIIGLGEMGIGNTTTSAAVLSALCGIDTFLSVGKGAGLSDEAYEKKKSIIEEALKLHQPDSKDPVDVLSKVGGFDIGAMAGAFIGAAKNKMPAVIDGYISMVSALLAIRLCPEVKEYLIPSHASYEKGFQYAAKEAGFEPVLHLNMRLGEGSGCPIMFSVLDGACAIMNHMATFEEANIATEYLDNISKDRSFEVE